jgi:hypothetical protein
MLMRLKSSIAALLGAAALAPALAQDTLTIWWAKGFYAPPARTSSTPCPGTTRGLIRT